MSTAIEVPFVRTKRGKADAFTSQATKPPEPLRPTRVARMLALAHTMQGLLDRGEVTGYGDLATIAGITRARVSQLLDLTRLAPDLQEAVLFEDNQRGRGAITERSLRAVVRIASWDEQRRHRCNPRQTVPLRQNSEVACPNRISSRIV